MPITTIQLDTATRKRLARLKSSPRETSDEGRYTDAFRVSLLNARFDIREGRGITNDQMKKRLGL